MKIVAAFFVALLAAGASVVGSYLVFEEKLGEQKEALSKVVIELDALRAESHRSEEAPARAPAAGENELPESPFGPSRGILSPGGPDSSARVQQPEEWEKERDELRARVRELESKIDSISGQITVIEAQSASENGELPSRETLYPAVVSILEEERARRQREQDQEKIDTVMSDVRKQIEGFRSEMNFTDAEVDAVVGIAENYLNQESELKLEYEGDELFEAQKELKLQLEYDLEASLGGDRYEQLWEIRNRGDWAEKDKNDAGVVDRTFTAYMRINNLPTENYEYVRTNVQETLQRVRDLEHQRLPTRDNSAIDQQIQVERQQLESFVVNQLGQDGLKDLQQIGNRIRNGENVTGQ
ncbi:MAG: hypothetical protein NUW37_00895 [Planctomycetes bacterium]|nr:hypothetical protein [Planctomycetota bacterium]